MPRTRVHNMNISLDGYAAGEHVTFDAPIGGAERLFKWFDGRAIHGVDKADAPVTLDRALTSLWSHRAREVVGVDFSARLIDEARRRHAHPRLDFQQAEAASLPFHDSSFDRVCCYNVLLSLPDHEYAGRALAEILRVVRPGARILIGSLPDVRKKARFFDLLDAAGPWYRRTIPRQVRWSAKRLLRPDSKPGETRILWFDPTEMSSRLRSAGWSVDVHDDPEIEDYPEYRFTLVLSRSEAKQVTG